MKLGMSRLEVSPPGVGAMAWGDATGLGRLHPSKSAYGGAETYEEENEGFELSLAPGEFDAPGLVSRPLIMAWR